MSWSSVALGEAADFFSGFAWKSKKFSDQPVGLPIIRIQNVGADASREFKYWPETYSERFIVSAGDLLLTLSGSFRTALWPGPDALLNQRIVKVTPRDHTDRQWLYWALEDAMSRIAGMGRHALVSNVALSDLKDLSINLPPLEEQRRIAGILDAADALRRRRREALALLDTLPGAIFAEMFGDPRDNPLGYPARKLSDLCSRITVGVVIKPASYYVDDGVPALRSVNVRDGTFDLKDLKYFSQETNDGPLKKSKMREGDVVIVRTGQPGRAAVVTEEIAGSNCIDMLIASPKEGELLPYFLEAFLNSDAGRQMALSNRTGQVQQHLNATALKGIDFITPPIEEQREFTQRLDEIRKVKEELTTHLCELDSLFASLQSRAFAGEL